jgi:hypothetical protein
LVVSDPTITRDSVWRNGGSGAPGVNSEGKDDHTMDEERFDELIKRLAEARITRSETIRGLAAGAGAALTGVVGLASTSAKPGKKANAKRNRKGKGRGKGKGKGKKNNRKVTICHFPPGNRANCTTIRVSAKSAQKHISRHGDTRGPCPYGC